MTPPDFETYVMAAAAEGPELEQINPYEGHPELSQLEADVLWEYAKLAKNVKMVCDVLVIKS